jgi:hypothetical protein
MTGHLEWAGAGAGAGGAVGWSVWLQVVLAIAAPCVVAAVWGAWLAPRARRRLADPARLALEVVLFLAGGLALLAAGQPELGAALAVLGVVNAVLVRVLGTATGDRA